MKTKLIYALAILAATLQFTGLFAGEKLESPINVNTASVEELVSLPGIGPSKAEAIVAYRQSHPFKAVSELTEVRGIGPKLLEKIQGFVTIDGSAPATVKN